MLLLVALGLGAPPALGAPPSPEPYATAVRLVDRLFLEPDRVDAARLLRAAARGVEAEVHWVRVRTDGDAVLVDHGDGTALGRVEVAGMEDLPRALQALEDLVARTGHDLDGVDVGLAVLSGMSDALDRYSRVLADERLDRFNVRLTGTLVGIGASFSIRGERMLVDEITSGGPAEQGGLMVGDEILRIDGRSTVSMPLSEATRRIRGQEGTQVALTVLREGSERSVALTRAEVVVPNVTRRVLHGDVGYVHIDHISQRTVENLRKELELLRAAGALSKGLVIDLRGNTGGSMKEAARAADQFLHDGLLLRTVGKDGGRVQNLQAEMRAVDDGDEPEIPVVILSDGRTASGSEILAGALVELERAAIVGTRSYGKGTVQKIYNLEDDVRLKLTVARYILANDREISEGGLAPDVFVGQIRLDGYGVRFRDWDEDRLLVPWERIVPEVVETPGWRGRDEEIDLSLELARRAVSTATGTSRAAVLAALERHTSELRAEQEARLAEALGARGIDWSPAAEEGTFLDARVEVEARPAGGDTYAVEVAVTNDGPDDLHRGLVQIDCRSASWWDGLVIPVGKVAPGATARGEVRVALSTGVAHREDVVEVRLRADKRPPLPVGEQVLRSESSPDPVLRLEARLAPGDGEVGPHGHPLKRAVVKVENLSKVPIPGLEVHFGYPGDDRVELMDHGARTGLVDARGADELVLGMEVAPSAPALLPLELVVEADRYRTLAEWPLSLPTTGEGVTLQAPAIEVKRSGLSAPPGPLQVPITVTDDRRVDHVVVWANGEKIAWAPGSGPKVSLTPTIDVHTGENRIVVLTEDDQGVSSRRTVSVRGEAPAAAVDAGE